MNAHPYLLVYHAIPPIIITYPIILAFIAIPQIIILSIQLTYNVSFVQLIVVWSVLRFLNVLYVILAVIIT